MSQTTSAAALAQYSLRQILLIWASAAIPMGILGWVVAPAFAHDGKPGFERIGILAIGLIWQFVLVTILLYREAGNLRWSNIKHRLWLQHPRDAMGEPKRSLWWWLIPVVLLTALYEFKIGGIVQKQWTSWLPFLSESQDLAFGSWLSTPESRAQLHGAWHVWLLFLVSAIFNTILGEELLFRGLLLPRMARVCGRWDFIVNGLLFALYHLHQPWGMLNSAIKGIFFFALPSRRFQCAWFGIVAHSGQSIYLAFLLLGLVLGLA